jgi:hypothetical protein
MRAWALKKRIPIHEWVKEINTLHGASRNESPSGCFSEKEAGPGFRSQGYSFDMHAWNSIQ